MFLTELPMVQLLVNQFEPLSEQQSVGIYNLQQSSQQAEDALTKSMQASQQSLAETLANCSAGPSGSSGYVANYGSNGHSHGKAWNTRGIPSPGNFIFCFDPIYLFCSKQEPCLKNKLHYLWWVICWVSGNSDTRLLNTL